MFPSINKVEGFIDDKDRILLKQKGIELAKTTTEKLYEENFNIYKALTTAEEKLFLSYTSSDNEGNTLRPSIIIKKIKKIFPRLQQTSDIISKQMYIGIKQTVFDDLLLNLRRVQDGENIDSIWFDIYEYFKQDSVWSKKLSKSIKGLNYDNNPEILSMDNVKLLYGDNLTTSISKLEQYRNCPFSYYLKYGLKLKEKDNFKMEAIDTGSFMHEVLDDFFEELDIKNINIKQIEEKQILEIINQIINKKIMLNKNYIFRSTKKYIVLTKKLKEVITKSIIYIIDTLKYSNFNVLGNEVEFDDNGKNYPAMEVELSNKEKVKVIGKIDRVDIGKIDENTYIRVIDYKSSQKSIDLNNVITGVQLQLLTYLDVVGNAQSAKSAGMFYFKLIDPIIKTSKNLSEDEIEDKIRKEFKMNGIIVADVNVVKSMDNKLQKGYSDIIPAYINKDGSLSEKSSNTLTQEEFQNLQKYIKRVIKQISEEIIKGRIDLNPIYNMKDKTTPCKYCDYKAICQFNPRICKNEYNYIPSYKKEEILEKIKDK